MHTQAIMQPSILPHGCTCSLLQRCARRYDDAHLEQPIEGRKAVQARGSMLLWLGVEVLIPAAIFAHMQGR